MSGLRPISMGAVSQQVRERRSGMLEESIVIPENKRVETTEFVPLAERMKAEKPEIAECLRVLKDMVGEDMFARRFDVLQNINRSGKDLLIVAGNERLRTLLLKDNLKDIMTAFKVENVRIVGGAGIGGFDAF